MTILLFYIREFPFSFLQIEKIKYTYSKVQKIVHIGKYYMIQNNFIPSR